VADETIQTYTPYIDQRLQHPSHKVYIRRYWTDDWTEVPEMFAIGTIDWLVAPSMSRATVAWRYGYRVNRKATTAEAVEPYHASEMVGMYVMVEFQSTDVKDEEDADGTITPPTWYGKVASIVDKWAGDHNSPEGQAIARGDQVFACLGMESILDQEPVISSFVLSKDENGDSTYKQINRCLPFNRVNGNAIDARMTLEGNKEPGFISGYASCFSGTLSASESDDSDNEPPERWTLSSVLRYLFEFHAPKNLDGEKIVKFDIRVNSVFEELYNHEIQLDRYEGLTLFQILNHLIDRRRGLGWFIEPKDTDGEISFEIVMFSFVDEDLDLPIGGKLSANDRLIELDLTNDRLGQVEVTTDGSVEYDQVIARGDRRGAVFMIGGESLGDDDDVRAPLAADYDTSTAADSLYDDYINGAATQDGFDGLPALEQLAAIDRYRRQNKFDRLGAWFCIDPTWDGKGVGDQGPVCPKLDESGETTEEASPMWLPGIRLERFLPLLSDLDYSGSRIADGDIADDLAALPKDSVPEYLPTTVFVKMPFYNEAEDEVGQWVPINLIGSRAGISGGWGVSIQAKVNESKPGVILRVQGGQGRTLRGFFLGRDQDTLGEDDDIAMQYSRDVDDLMIVAYAKFDDYVESRLPIDDDIEDAVGGKPDTVRRKVIYLPDCHLDWIPKGTPVGYDTTPDEDGVLKFKPKITTQGAFVRDDRERLETAAKLASKFYLRSRQAVSIEWSRLRRIVDRGWFVMKIIQTARVGDNAEKFDTDVATPVTAIRYDVVGGRTSIETGFGELDVARMSKVT